MILHNNVSYYKSKSATILLNNNSEVFDVMLYSTN